MTEKIAITNGAVLTAHEATVQTVQVEIRVMKVGKKQVTMGMFRQLPYRDLIAWDEVSAVSNATDVDDEVLLGIPWGHVNYRWDGDHPRYCVYTNEFGNWIGRGERRHIVWERDGTLYRSFVCECLPPWVGGTEISRLGETEVIDLRCAWYKVWRRLDRLPQLFIAV